MRPEGAGPQGRASDGERVHLARILYGKILNQKAYDEAEAFKVTHASLAHRLQNLQKQAAKLGLQLVPAA